MRRGLRFLLATVALLAVLCTGAWADGPTEVESSDGIVQWTAANSPYVVSKDATIKGRITVSGAVELILSDDCTLTAESGITVNAANGGNSLTIKVSDDARGTGTLKASTTGQSAAIGGLNNDSIAGARVAGTITIKGGIVEAKATRGAGIGGAHGNNGTSGSGGTIIINGGTVKASATSGAGIGGPESGSGGNITITSGTVTSESTKGGAGIGGGNGKGGDSGTITISGGDVRASSTPTGENDHSGAGIGGGVNGSGEIITISGGTVEAYASGGGAGIGSGYTMPGNSTTGGTITISGGKVKAIGDYDNVNVAGIGRGASGGTATAGMLSSGPSGGSAWIEASKVNADKSAFRSGVLIEKSDGKVFGFQTIKGEATIPAGTTLAVDTSRRLIVASGGTLNIVKDAYLDIRHDGLGDPGLLKNDGGTIKNDGYVRLLDGTDIKALKMTGSGTVEMGGKTYDNDGNDKNPPAPTPQTTLPQREAVTKVLDGLNVVYPADPLMDDSIDKATAVSVPGLVVAAQMTISQKAAEGSYIEVNGETLSTESSDAVRFYKVFRNLAGTDTEVHEFGPEYVKTVDGAERVEFDAVVVIINSAAPEEKPEGFVAGAIEGQGLVERSENGYKVVVVWDGEPEDGVAFDPIVAATAVSSDKSSGACSAGAAALVALAALAMIKRRTK